MFYGYGSWQTEDGESIDQVFDYLQVCEDNDHSTKEVTKKDNHQEEDEWTLSAIRILRNPYHYLREDCIVEGWIDGSSGTILSLPVGKKKRSWRFWVCYLLCLNVFPQPNVRIDQLQFTEKLGGVDHAGGPVALRRELVEYGLIQREGDGSAYWRPPYTVQMVRQWLKGMPRKII